MEWADGTSGCRWRGMRGRRSTKHRNETNTGVADPKKNTGVAIRVSVSDELRQ